MRITQTGQDRTGQGRTRQDRVGQGRARGWGLITRLLTFGCYFDMNVIFN